ncbi:MAG: hypothetical protein L6416_08135 [Candidatus Omnitrophica bacterium]|nr:hypothetical protein [Candidatus Omnitrophota bacterium]
MKREINILFGILVAIFLTIWFVGSEHMPSFYKNSFVFLVGIGIVVTLVILDRFIIFRKKLDLALKHILENNFHTGISMQGKDEFSLLAEKFNKAIDRINEFDILREHRVDTINRLLLTLNRNIQNGIMLLDIKTSRIKINKAAQEIFSISQDELSIDSVIKLEANSEFRKMYHDILERRANTISADLELFLPILKAKAVVSLKMFAIKDKDEKLNSILCIFRKT